MCLDYHFGTPFLLVRNHLDYHTLADEAQVVGQPSCDGSPRRDSGP